MKLMRQIPPNQQRQPGIPSGASRAPIPMAPSMIKYVANAAFVLLSMPAVADNFHCSTPVTVAARADAAKGDYSSAIQLKDIAVSPTTIGYGATANLAQEITIVDGRLYLTGQANGTVRLRSAIEPGEGAFKLVSMSPASWRMRQTLGSSASLDDLEALIEQLAGQMQCQQSDQLPFKINGYVNSVEWSVVNGTPGADFISVSDEVAVTIVGVFSRTQKQRLGIGTASKLHVHVYLPQLNLAGHVRKIRLEAGAQLFLPAAR